MDIGTTKGLTILVGGFASKFFAKWRYSYTDIANHGYDEDFLFKRYMLALLNPQLMIYLLS